MSVRTGNDLFVMPSDDNGPEKLLQTGLGYQWPLDWSKDARFLMYFSSPPEQTGDLLALPVGNPGSKPIPIADSPFNERTGTFSPDSHFVAYDTDESGRFEVVVQSFPERRCKAQVSVNGGIQARWSANGKELYFIAPDLKLMASTIDVTKCPIEVGVSQPLFQTNLAVGTGPLISKQQYDVSSDGRFLINQAVVPAAGPPPIKILLNWKAKGTN
jgi:eukaryotic-like serine/threonine-protein kinase